MNTQLAMQMHLRMGNIGDGGGGARRHCMGMGRMSKPIGLLSVAPKGGW